jgi:nucleotide-binding universal stress UspA family protein
MMHLWGPKTKEGAEMGKSALGDVPPGDIAVVVCGEQLDSNLVSIGCLMAKGLKRRVHLLHVIEVPRSLPLNATLEKETNRADKILKSAMDIATRIGCEAIPEVVQAREAGSAIVEEAKDHHCALILIGQRRLASKQPDRSKAITYVLANAPCRVWLMQDPNPTATPATAPVSAHTSA